jgi:hypothetical protein
MTEFQGRCSQCQTEVIFTRTEEPGGSFRCSNCGAGVAVAVTAAPPARTHDEPILGVEAVVRPATGIQVPPPLPPQVRPAAAITHQPLPREARPAEPVHDPEDYVYELIDRGRTPKKIRRLLVERAGLTEDAAWVLVEKVLHSLKADEIDAYAEQLVAEGKNAETLRSVLVKEIGLSEQAAKTIMRRLPLPKKLSGAAKDALLNDWIIRIVFLVSGLVILLGCSAVFLSHAAAGRALTGLVQALGFGFFVAVGDLFWFWCYGRHRR